jgi:putative FmdB family regulatory protein
MHTYDFKCNACGATFALSYKTYRDYDNATPTCPGCGSDDLTRLITRVNIRKGGESHEYTQMNANQMLSVFESGDSKAVGEMMRQVGAGAPPGKLGEDYTNAADRLSSGDSLDNVERDLRNNALGEPPSEPPSDD